MSGKGGEEGRQPAHGAGLGVPGKFPEAGGPPPLPWLPEAGSCATFSVQSLSRCWKRLPLATCNMKIFLLRGLSPVSQFLKGLVPALQSQERTPEVKNELRSTRHCPHSHMLSPKSLPKTEELGARREEGGKSPVGAVRRAVGQRGRPNRQPSIKGIFQQDDIHLLFHLSWEHRDPTLCGLPPLCLPHTPREQNSPETLCESRQVLLGFTIFLCLDCALKHGETLCSALPHRAQLGSHPRAKFS